MNTFKDLYNFLQDYKDDNIIKWLNDPWQGKDKQESLLRLFSGLGLIEKLNKFNVCKGNFNLKTISKHQSLHDIFYDQNKFIQLKDKGDASDLTCISKENDHHLLLTTSKNLNKTNVGKLDIDKILTNFKQYDGYTMTLCICIRNRKDFIIMKKGIESTNKELKNLLDKEDTIIIDWEDLNQAFHHFKLSFQHRDIKNIMTSNKSMLCLKMHQQLGVMKTLYLKNDKKENKILWGHVQRSGKSYIIGGCIIQDSLQKNICNYLVITTAPNETIEQQRKVFDCMQLQDFNIIILNAKDKNPPVKDKNIIICSKQFLQGKIDNVNEKIKNITWLKKISFDMRFIDESHNGGTTELAQKTLDTFGKNSFTVQITATYAKPINNYNISKENRILWDLEDITLCKNIDKDGSIDDLVVKHGPDIKEVIQKYSLKNIKAEYAKYPELWILTDEIKPQVATKILQNTKNNEYGWSPETCFLLKQGIQKDSSEIDIKEEFQNETEILKLWYRIFGKKGNFGIPDKEYSEDKVFIKRIEKICKNHIIGSRFIGEGDFRNEPMIIMAFLPQNNIDKLSRATIKLFDKYSLLTDYVVISINSKTTNNPKQTIEDGRVKARNSYKKGVLVLSGRQCSLGVSIDNCDIVLLLNNNMGFDLIYQMMFRCMTEGKNKKCGFVVDLNIHRVIETSIVHYASLVKPTEHPKDGTKYILQERLINLNGDHWMPSFDNDESKITYLSETIYDLYASNAENALHHFLNRLKFKEVQLSRDEQKIFNMMFRNSVLGKQQKKIIDKLIADDEKIKKGLERSKLENSDVESEISDDSTVKEEKPINYTDILRHLIPLLCLLTIHNEETSFNEMFDIITNDDYKYNILIDQIKSWWNKNIDGQIIKLFINVYNKQMKDDIETNKIIRTIKELFIKNVGNRKELSKLIDKYLIPQELEKKSNAEVSTPYTLRQEMLDKIPLGFWKSPRRVFEPCSGKGGFVIDIIDRFMIGLEDKIPNEKERYRKIVEECLYFSDINPTNIFICTLLINSENEYKLNYNEGNTLELDVQKKWSIDGFDAVIGNPPYNDASGNKGKGHTLWDKFVIISLSKWVIQDGYLLYVHPSLWRQADHSLQKTMKEYQIEYLEIHNESDGVKIFGCNTRYDWYLINKNKYYKKTIIKTQDGTIIRKDLSKMNFIPNYNFDTIEKLTNNKEKINLLYSRSDYASDKKWTNKICDSNYKYPIVYSVNRKNIPKFIWSNINSKTGHFGKKKVIFGSGATGFIIDDKGLYGCSEFCTGIIDEIKNLNNIKEALNSIKFKKEIIMATSVSKAEINRKILKYFNKDFWKEFV